MVTHSQPIWKITVVLLGLATSACGQLLGIDELTDGTTSNSASTSSSTTTTTTTTATGGAGGSGGAAAGGSGGMGGSTSACKTLGAGSKVVWAKQFGDKGNQFVSDAALLTTGLLSVCGLMDAGNLTIGSDMLTNKTASLDAFVFQLSSTGEPLWARSSNGKGQDWCSTLAARGSETLLTGTADDVIAFDKSKPIGSSSKQAFLYGLAASGNATDAPLAFAGGGGNLLQVGKGVAPFSSGVLVAGTYQGSVGTSDKEITTTALEGAFAARVHANDSDYLVNLGDADLLGETSRYVNYAVVDSSDNAFIVGDFSGDVAFMGDTKAKNQGDRDVFIIKLDPNGKVLFAKTFGSTGKDTPLAIAIAPNKSFYVAGMFGGKILLDGHELLAVGEGDAFLLRFADADGTLMWASTLAGGGEQQLRKIAVADSGDVYAAGRNDGAMVTPSGTIEGIHDGFVVAYDNSGAWRGAITLDDGLSGSLQVGGLAVDGCRLVVVAQFSGTLQLGSDSFIANNSIDLAVASYDLAFTE